MRKTCKICGRPFITLNAHGKYCSEACREAGRQRTRKAWESRTGYLEKKRIQERQRRARLAEEEQQESIARGKQRSEDFARELEERQARELAELRKAAAAGDYDAQMVLAKSGGEIDWRAYWKAYKAADIDFARQWNKDSTRTVNGISVYDPHFEDKVMDAIQQQGVIITAL